MTEDQQLGGAEVAARPHVRLSRDRYGRTPEATAVAAGARRWVCTREAVGYSAVGIWLAWRGLAHDRSRPICRISAVPATVQVTGVQVTGVQVTGQIRDLVHARNRAARDSGYALMGVQVADEAVVADLARTGVLRASINLGNPVLAQGTGQAPAGVTVDLSREIAARLGVPVALACFDAARKSFEALRTGAADIGFLAIEPARQAEVWFTAPYVLIEGVYAVPAGSPIMTAAEIDRPGVRIGVKEGSAYDLYLTRTLTHAEVVRGGDAVDVFREHHLDAVAGIRQPLTRLVAGDPALRLAEPRFMQIRQAAATTLDRSPAAKAFLRALIEDLKAAGFIASALARSGQDATVAPAS